jgi:cobalt-zinc-cadmium efflux system protein
MSHSHNHTHEHNHRPGSRNLIIVLSITAAYMLAEFLGGILTNSLALLADAGHMLSDVGSMTLSVIAMRFASKPRTASMTYGYFRAEILAAMANGITLVVVAIVIVYQAVMRLQAPPEVHSAPMLAIATVGLLVNLVGAWILFGKKDENLNVRGAFLHVLADALGSVGAIAAGVAMLVAGWYLADPIVSLFVALLILLSSGRLLKESVKILMEGAPSHIDMQALEATIRSVPGINDVHDLHVWTVTSGFDAVSVHIGVTHCDTMADGQQLLTQLRDLIKERHGIDHTTIQLECPPHCSGCS